MASGDALLHTTTSTNRTDRCTNVTVVQLCSTWNNQFLIRIIGDDTGIIGMHLGDCI